MKCTGREGITIPKYEYENIANSHYMVVCKEEQYRK